jgi:hypothetical protein
MSTLEGKCHCGAVTVSIPDDSPGVIACHCGDCQKLHGNFFAMLAVDRDKLQWGADSSVKWYDSSNKARRSFCKKCGSRLAKDPHGSPKVLVSVGLFPKDIARRIQKQVMPESKPAWYDLPHEG